MATTRDLEHVGESARVNPRAKAAEFVRRLRLQADRVDAGLVSGDDYQRVTSAIWGTVAGAGPEVERAVAAALRACLGSVR